MTGLRHGIVIGKFYPPTLGHHHLIRTAAANVERLTVVCMAAAVETIPLADRVAWLRAEHAADTTVTVVGIRCDAPTDYDDETVWAAQVALMRAAVATVTAEPVDAVFTSEEYGGQLASWFGAKHVPIDPDRTTVPISGSAVRADLAVGWAWLAPATRAGLTTRVVLVGAESTGTTTISQLLAEHYRSRGGVWASTRWVGEYGREYTAIKWERDRAARPDLALDDLEWTADDFDAVATEQTRRETVAAAAGSPLLVCDTDAFATAVWERRYLGPQARSDQAWASALPRRAIYLVTDHDGVPWVDDGLREGDQSIRAAMTGWFAEALTRAGKSWMLLTGSLDQRLSLAVRTTDLLLAQAATFAAPLTQADVPDPVAADPRGDR
ncbi:AAA family ATPase [Rugosimonospora africana]|uniref:Transcriptional regulator NadR n=1 Tax=Rugosimonospora africana TaxID=556532 RepID=A0A8J3VR21_9ACTN|nr:AAA family ATPase [Rugosimonospora africana]GIH14953.1 transcriptional regulator NadR [Rugosimonospora africana]